jgi:hypothetical protein
MVISCPLDTRGKATRQNAKAAALHSTVCVDRGITSLLACFVEFLTDLVVKKAGYTLVITTVDQILPGT